MKESRKRALANYEKKCRHFMIRLNIEEDGDIIEWLEDQASGNAAIKALIRQNISRKKKK
jgi:hypothetical protein